MKDETVGEKQVRTKAPVVGRRKRARFTLEAMRLLPSEHGEDILAAALADEWRDARRPFSLARSAAHTLPPLPAWRPGMPITEAML